MEATGSTEPRQAVVHGPDWTPDSDAPALLRDVLRRAAQHGRADDLVYVLPNGSLRSESYAELWASAGRFAAAMHAAGLRAGDPLLLQLEGHQNFFAALWGCFFAGILPLPTAVPPSYGEPSGPLERLRQAWALTGQAPILTDVESDGAVGAQLAAWFGRAPRLLHFNGSTPSGRDVAADPSSSWGVSHPLEDGPAAPVDHHPRPEDPALLILTSGSTDRPRAVLLTHRNLTWAVAASAEANGCDSSDRNLNWMPLQHIGALAFHIRDVYARARQVHVATAHVLEQPLRWLDLLDRFRASICWAPNFAFGLVNDLADKVAAGRWELAALRVLLNGSEAIVPSTARRFLELLAPHGLSPTALVPCWGMSETAAAVTYGRRFHPRSWEAEPEAVETGTPISGVSLRIVDEEGRLVTEGTIGRVQVMGAAVTPGYWRDEAATRAALTDDGWWRTGDLGSLRDGQLTITGREKTLVVIHGVKYANQAIEAYVAEVPGVHTVAACAVPAEGNRSEELAVFVSPRTQDPQSLSELVRHIRQRVLEKVGVAARWVVVLPLEEFPRTETGKLRHLELRRRFAAGEYRARCWQEDAPSSDDQADWDEVEREVAGVFCAVLGRTRLGLDESFFDAGGDSLQVMRVVGRVRDVLGVHLPARELFVAPTVRALSRRVRSSRGPAVLPAIEHQDESLREWPLSDAQQRLWLLSQLDPADPAYHVSVAVERGDPSFGAYAISGRLDVRAMELSLTTLAARHAALRTRFHARDGHPYQVVDAVGETRAAQDADELESSSFPRRSAGPLHYRDLRLLGMTERQAAVDDEARFQQQESFDLAHGPLWRASLLRLADESYLFFFLVHHIVADGWSVGILRRELSACYAAFCRGATPELPVLPVRYTDYAVWQRQWMQGEEFQFQRRYWRQHLQGLTPLRLPTDYGRRAGSSNRGAARSLLIPQALTERLEEFSRREGTTLFMTLLAAFKTLWLRYLGQSDIAIGTPSANRVRPELEGLVGFFVNTLVLRTKLEGNLRFQDLLSRVRDTALDAFSHQSFPFERLVEELQTVRSAERNPLFEVLFAVHNLALEPLELCGLDVRCRQFDTLFVRFDLQWDVWPGPAGLQINAFYRTALFDAATVDGWLRHFHALLDAIVRDANARVLDLPLLSADDRSRLATFGSARELDSIPDATSSLSGSRPALADLFQRQARSTPSAVALVCEGQPWTYQRLDESADRVATGLRGLGVGLESVVAIAVERSPELLAGILGILQADAAYLSLDLDQPDQRLARILHESGVGAVLASSSQARRLTALAADASALPDGVLLLDGGSSGDDPLEGGSAGQRSGPAPVSRQGARPPVRIVRIEDLLRCPKESDDRPRRSLRASGDHIACVMYTSGTTGGPKGVVVTHRAIVRLVCDTPYMEVGPDDAFLQLSPPAFDASTFEIWTPLLHGARLVLPPPGVPSPQELEELLRRNGVTVLWLTAGLFHLMVRECPAALRRLRYVLAGGDVLRPECVEAFFREPGQAVLINGYGPTENTTFTCCHPMREPPGLGLSVPIGRPVPETELFVLDEALGVVPAGGVGELYIGGGGLARGYLNDPLATADRFVPHPFARVPGSRLYRSGDLVRYRHDGALEFIGRRDRQVKIRGHRVDPREIEFVLGQHPGVRQAAVVVREDRAGDKRVVAYVETDRAGLESELRGFAGGRLPGAFVPHGIVCVPALPLTPRGKVDYAALPAATIDDSRPAAGHVAPRTPTERTLCAICSAVLGVPRVGVHDNFFERGGESLLAMQVVSRVRDAFGFAVPLRQLFESPTVAELAVALTQGAARQADAALVTRLLEDVERLSDQQAMAQLREKEQLPDG